VDNSYVYILKCNEYYKIGIAVFPERRIGELQVGNPYELEIVATYKFPKHRVSYMEKRLHRAFEHWNVRGEWFLLSDAKLGVIRNQLNALSH
jgi:hypothetical protein